MLSRLPALGMSEPAAHNLAAPAAAAGASASTAAAAAAAGASTATAAAAAADQLASKLSRLEVSMQHKHCAAKLVSTCRSGQDLLQVMAQQGGPAQQQQQQQEALVQLLRECQVVDKHDRNLLHLVATHSL
jgi:hypothetical protein